MNRFYFILTFFILITLFSCKTKIETKENYQKDDRVISPENDKEDNNKNDKKNSYSEGNKNDITKEKRTIEKKETFSFEINILNGVSEVFINDKSEGLSPLSLSLEVGVYDVILKRKDYPDQFCQIDIHKNTKITLKHNKDRVLFKEMGVFECGDQPKQVIFSPDDNFVLIPLLDDGGFQIFDMRAGEIINFLKPNRADMKGFAEGLFVTNNSGETSFIVSQMTTGYIYEYSYPQFEFKRELLTGGKWSKYIAYSKTLNILAVSNWATNDVSIIDYDTGKLIKLLPTDQAPRGVIFTDDGNYLIVLNFDGGTIQKFSTKKWKLEKSIYKQNAAMRHVVMNSGGTRIYVSNMYHFEIYEIDIETFKILKTYKVYYNPNTIDLKDDRLLFVSSRGPNDNESYLNRSPKNGRITVIDVEKGEIINVFEGGNQPTGLDVSNNGKYLCFSNFRDRNIEIYNIGDYNYEN